MPLYEYYCENCAAVFEKVRPFSASEEPAACPTCSGRADRILPTTFASMSVKGGWKQRVPFHHHSVRTDKQGKRADARLKPRVDSEPPTGLRRKAKTGGQTTRMGRGRG